MTKEEVVEIMTYCKEHGMTYRARLAELNIPVWRFTDSKSHYAAEQRKGQAGQGEFIKLPHAGTFVPVPTFAGSTSRRRKPVKTGCELKSVEIRTNAGTAIRIQGGFTENELCSIIKACSNVQP